MPVTFSPYTSSELTCRIFLTFFLIHSKKNAWAPSELVFVKFSGEIKELST